MFCVECGQEGPIYKNGVCLACYLKGNRFTEGPVIIDITTCPRCEAYKFKNTWVQEPFDQALQRHLKAEFTIKPEMQNPTFQADCKEQDKIYACQVTISGMVGGQAVLEQHPLTVRLRRITCDVCSREAGGYYEAIIQIRAEQRTFNEDELERLYLQVKGLVDAAQKSKRGIYITDYEVKREGLDFFLSDKGIAQSIARRLQDQYGAEFKTSASNVGMKDSRQLYRTTFLVRLPRYQPGDFLLYQREPMRLRGIYNRKAKLQSLATWEESAVDVKSLTQASPLNDVVKHKEMIVVSQTPSEVQLMDEASYKITTIPKPKKHTFSKEKTEVIRYNDVDYLLPEKE
jgi:nonsense-mediated mRNA decay protein 3